MRKKKSSTGPEIILPASINERLDKSYSRGLWTGVVIGIISSSIADLIFRYVL